MRSFISISRVLVGVLFIISGLVKANDPLGLAYKMQEFFEVWNSDLAAGSFFAKGPLIALFQYLHGHALLLSVVMITLEIVAGAALLVGWRRNAVLRLLGLLIVFFTFLTAYALWSGKFKNCGCFGDCLPISPLASFVKDLVLAALIGALWAGRRHLRAPVTKPVGAFTVLGALLAAVATQWYVLNYLPVADCLPFKKGNNISQQMQVPAGARPDSFAIRFVYEKAGQRHEFAAEQLPADLDTYTYVDRIDKLVRKGNAEPPIKGFALTGMSGTDSTGAILNLPEVFLLFAEQINHADTGWLDGFRELAAAAAGRGVPVYLATAASLDKAAVWMAEQGLTQVPLFACDFTAIRTAARTAPTLYHLKKGTIAGKYSARQIGSAAAGKP